MPKKKSKEAAPAKKRVSSAERKKKKAAAFAGKKAVDKWRTVSPGPGFPVWIAVWIFALLFTQLLRSPASNIFFGFVTFLPVASLIYTLISRSALKTYMVSDTAVTEKLAQMEYEFRLINESVLPYPFIDAYLKLPQTNSVKTTERCVRLSMAPMSDYDIDNTVSFRFRGTYEIGVSCLYVYDFFRIIRVKNIVESYTSVYVLPRKLVIDEDAAMTVSDSAQQTKKSPNSYEKLEVSDIRDYRLGDPLKSIHSKLSSKTEDLIVKDYNSGSTDTTYIFADLSKRFPDELPEKPFVSPYADETELPPPDVSELVNAAAYEDMNEYCADGVVELTVASVLRELRGGRSVILMWYDERSEIGAFVYEFRSPADFDSVFKLFSTAPVAPSEKTVAGLTRMVGDAEDAKFIFVLPTLDEATVASLCTMSCASDSSSTGNEVIVYTAEERFAHPKERGEFLDSCRMQLAERGLALVKGSLDGFIEMPKTDKKNKKGE